MPDWQIWNVLARVAVDKQYTFQAVVENIFDINYWVFASGISGAGRNLVVKPRAGL